MSMNSEYIDERYGGYYVAGTRISLDSVVYSFNHGRTPDAILESFPLLTLSQIYGAIAFYLDHREAIDRYLERKQKEMEASEASAVPLREANPELWAKIEKAREALAALEP